MAPEGVRTLRLPAELVESLRCEASESYPGESCGFLIGEAGAGVAAAHQLRGAANRAARPDRYTIEARDVYEAIREARRAGQQIVGVYHSHPDAPPYPSATDAAEAWGGWLHLIVGCLGGTGGELRCWRWAESEFVEVGIDVG